MEAAALFRKPGKRCTKFAPNARGFAISAAAFDSVDVCAANGFAKIELVDDALENGCGGKCLRKLSPNGALLEPDLFKRKLAGDAIVCL